MDLLFQKVNIGSGAVLGIAFVAVLASWLLKRKKVKAA